MNQLVTKGWIVEGVIDGHKIHSRMYIVREAADEYARLLRREIRTDADVVDVRTVTGFEGKQERAR